MRIRRSAKFFMVYVKAKGMRFPVIIPIPLVIVEELLQGLVIVAWLAQGILCQWILRRQYLPASAGGGYNRRALNTRDRNLQYAYQVLSYVAPWRMLAGLRNCIREIRRQAPHDFVNVEAKDVKVRIGFL